jgi:hypothetical protein
MPEVSSATPNEVGAALAVLRKHGAHRIAFCATAQGSACGISECGTDRIALIPDLDEIANDRLTRSGWSVYGLKEVPDDVDAVLIVDADGFRGLMRALEPLARRGCLILPASRDWVVPRELREGDAMYTAWRTTSAANYAARCNLKGHYVEFGTFWGSSFFPNYFRFRHWLDGSFFAFDSFQGLSCPQADESRFTGGDFVTGAYCANERSFHALADFLGVPSERFSVIGGFFEYTLGGVAAKEYGLEPGSVSVCYIDCDLKEPTQQVLEFVTPLLESGALIYFDDWRLCRASRTVGERAAALEWLQQNPGFELIELDRNTWQDQWFIFQKS